MRLAIVSQQGRKAAGAEHALLQFVARLPPNVELAWFFLEDGEFAEMIRGMSSSVTIVGMSQRVASAQRGGLRLDAVSDSMSVTFRLALALSRARPHVVLTNSMKAHVVGSLAAKLARLPCVNYIHDIVEGSALTLLRSVSRLCAVERLTCSKAVKAHMNLARTSVVYAAIDVASFAALPDRHDARRTLGLPAEIPVVGLVGRIARWKGQDRFLRIAAAVVARRRAHFCIVGSPIFGCDNAYVDGLYAEVARLKLESHVTFVPWQDDMQTVYAALDVACNCSAREPFGRTSLEALASGVPIVCFDDAGVCEIFEQNRGGIRVASGDDAAFASAVISQLDALDSAGTSGADARSAARAMDISLAYEAFIAAIERVANLSLSADRAHRVALEPQTAGGASGQKRQVDPCLVK